MIYDYGKGTEKNFIVAADEFGQDKGFLQKYEPVMCIGNGYMCMRAATEEEYPGQLRSTLVATFHPLISMLTAKNSICARAFFRTILFL